MELCVVCLCAWPVSECVIFLWYPLLKRHLPGLEDSSSQGDAWYDRPEMSSTELWLERRTQTLSSVWANWATCSSLLIKMDWDALSRQSFLLGNHIALGRGTWSPGTNEPVCGWVEAAVRLCGLVEQCAGGDCLFLMHGGLWLMVPASSSAHAISRARVLGKVGFSDQLFQSQWLCDSAKGYQWAPKANLEYGFTVRKEQSLWDLLAWQLLAQAISRLLVCLRWEPDSLGLKSWCQLTSKP